MRTLLLIGAGAGAVLLGYGLLKGAPEPKGLKPLGAAPEDPNVLPKHDPSVIPTHTKEDDEAERAKANYCQLYIAYEQEKRRYQALATEAKMRMDELERLAQNACNAYAQRPVYKYHCNGFPVCGWNEWYTVKGSARDPEAYNLCLNSVKGGATLPTRKHPYRPKLSKTGRQQLDDLNREIEAGYKQAKELREKWKEQKGRHDRYQAKVIEFQKKIRDLEAQGVYCG